MDVAFILDKYFKGMKDVSMMALLQLSRMAFGRELSSIWK